MKLFNCIAYLTIVSAILIGLAIGYRDDPLTFRLLAALGLYHAVGADDHGPHGWATQRTTNSLRPGGLTA